MLELAREFDERVHVVVSLFVFALPAIVFPVVELAAFPWIFVGILPLFVVAGPLLYCVLTAAKGSSNRTEPSSRHFDWEMERGDTELVAANYEQLNEQATYRDSLLINANYFSLAILGVLVNVFFRVNDDARPLIAMVGAVTAYAFWLATESYKNTRDSLNGKLRDIETRKSPDFNVVSTYDDRDRSPVGKRSLSSYLIGLQIAATGLWTVTYFAYVVYLGYF